MNEETSAGAPPRVQARGQDAAMQTETATSTDWPTRRRGERRGWGGLHRVMSAEGMSRLENIVVVNVAQEVLQHAD